MDQLIEILIRYLIDMFAGSAQKPTPLPQRPPPRPPAPGPVAQRRPLPKLPPLPQRTAPRQGQTTAARPVARSTQRIAQPPPAPTPVQQAPPTQSAAPSVKHPSVAVDAAALRRWLKPKILRDQFILSEIFQPPMALRDPRI